MGDECHGVRERYMGMEKLTDGMDRIFRKRVHHEWIMLRNISV